MKIKALIVDDEQNARENLKLLVQNYCKNIEIVGLAHSANYAQEQVKLLNPDLIFLDINMPQKNGFDFLREVKPKNFQVIFVTAHSEYALEAFKANAVDYIEKPIDIDHLLRATKKAEDILSKPQAYDLLSEDEEKIAIPTRRGYTFIAAREVVYFKASENYTLIILNDGRELLSSKTLAVYEDKMNPETFFRIHKTYMINVQHHLKEVVKGKEKCAKMSNGECLPIARRRSSTFLKAISH